MIRSVTASSAFRLAWLYAALFGGSVLVLLGFLYVSTAGYMAHQTDEAINAEIDVLADRYRLRGLPGLTALIAERIEGDPGRLSLYLLADRYHEPLIGNLSRWPEVLADARGWLNFTLQDVTPKGATTHPARARTFRLRDGFFLLVGRDMQELSAARRLIVRALGFGMGITLLLAIAGGWILSRSALRRIEAINQTARDIMHGELTRRIPLRGNGDDYDQLAQHLNAMLDRIQELMDGVRQVANNIAHDLKTPLNRLRQSLEALRDTGVESDTGRELADRAVREADGLLATFDGLLRIARIESGERRAGFRIVELAPLARDVAELYEPLAEQRDITLQTDAPDPVRIRGDRDLLFQALANIVDNAVKYTPGGGRVAIALRDEDTRAVVEIGDSGPGIPAALRQRVLERFYRLESSRSTPGNGLGLSLVAAVAQLHDAELQLTDNHPGLRVRLSFPVGAPEGDAGGQESGSPVA